MPARVIHCLLAFAQISWQTGWADGLPRRVSHAAGTEPVFEFAVAAATVAPQGAADQGKVSCDSIDGDPIRHHRRSSIILYYIDVDGECCFRGWGAGRFQVQPAIRPDRLETRPGLLRTVVI